MVFASPLWVCQMAQVSGNPTSEFWRLQISIHRVEADGLGDCCRLSNDVVETVFEGWFEKWVVFFCRNAKNCEEIFEKTTFGEKTRHRIYGRLEMIVMEICSQCNAKIKNTQLWTEDNKRFCDKCLKEKHQIEDRADIIFNIRVKMAKWKITKDEI